LEHVYGDVSQNSLTAEEAELVFRELKPSRVAEMAPQRMKAIVSDVDAELISVNAVREFLSDESTLAALKVGEVVSVLIPRQAAVG